MSNHRWLTAGALVAALALAGAAHADPAKLWDELEGKGTTRSDLVAQLSTGAGVTVSVEP